MPGINAWTPRTVLTPVFLSFIVATVLTRIWLGHRQESHITAHIDRVPAAFSARISLPEHRRAARYSLARLRLGRVTLAWETLWLLLWTLGGGINLVDQLWRTFGLANLTTGLAVIFTLLLLSWLIELPFALYRTFVIEENFGFNQTTVQTWFADLLKTGVLIVVAGGPLLFAILWLMERADDRWWLYAWFTWMSFNLMMIWAYPVLIAPMFNRFTPLEDNGLRERIEALLKRSGFNSKGVFVVDGSRRSSHGNAYFTGFGSNKRIVFFDTLLKALSADEVEAVLAHELGHFKRNHIVKSLLISALVSLGGFALLAWLMQAPWFYRDLGVAVPSTHAALILFVLALPVFTFFIGPLFAALSRKHEFEADEFAHSNSNYKSLISALVNMYRDNASTLTPDPLYSMFYDSHPPATIRIDHLESLASGGGRG